jgi:hypothetical protein
MIKNRIFKLFVFEILGEIWSGKVVGVSQVKNGLNNFAKNIIMLKILMMDHFI